MKRDEILRFGLIFFILGGLFILFSVPKINLKEDSLFFSPGEVLSSIYLGNIQDSNQKVITPPEGEEIVIDYSKGTITSEGITTNIIIDDLKYPAEFYYKDLNGDGKEDLVRKEVDGKYYVYYNKGDLLAPLYREGVVLGV